MTDLTPKKYDLGVESGHIASLAKTPLLGIIELIWNALDADATEISVEFTEGELGGIEAVHVRDNGHGISPEFAQSQFSSLGGSWKSSSSLSPGGRKLHGKQGQGRFKVLGLGATARWKSVFQDEEGDRTETEIRIGSDDLVSAYIRHDSNSTNDIGTQVVIEGFTEPPPGLKSEKASNRIAAEFALEIRNHDIQIWYDGSVIDISDLLEREETTDFEVAGQNVHLTILEWNKNDLSRSIFLCGSNGKVVEGIETRIQAPGFKFTAYLSWNGFESQEFEAATIEFQDGEANKVLEGGRDQLRQYFRKRLQEKRRATVTAWQLENVYPFSKEPAGDVEVAVRDTFDLVALQAADVINQASSASNKRLSLALLKESLEKDPSHLHEVLRQVLTLPEAEVIELSELLKESPLSTVIRSTRTVTDRLKVLSGLRLLVADPEWKKRLKEREQLHKILEVESWVFGDEYSLTASDKSIHHAMQQHIKLLGRESLIDESSEADELVDESGHRRILDLMLSRTVKRQDDVREHLVVELKRPSVRVGDTELAQIKNYARALASHDAFDQMRTRWTFLVVSTAVSESVEADRSQPQRRHGIAFEDPDGRYCVWVKQWSEVLHDADSRLRFIQDQLEVDVEAGDALDHLRTKHASVLSDDE